MAVMDVLTLRFIKTRNLELNGGEWQAHTNRYTGRNYKEALVSLDAAFFTDFFLCVQHLLLQEEKELRKENRYSNSNSLWTSASPPCNTENADVSSRSTVTQPQLRTASRLSCSQGLPVAWAEQTEEPKISFFLMFFHNGMALSWETSRGLPFYDSVSCFLFMWSLIQNP